MAQASLLYSALTLLNRQFASKDLKTVGNYTLGKLIGKGSFGKVYLARHNLTNGSKVVLKASNKEDSNLAREIHHHRQFVHPHIARLYEVIITETLVWLVLEYCPGDELYNYLCRNGPLPVESVQKIFTQLVGAVAYIHSKSCVHRDLKLENVLLDKHDNVKLCDFGFTREYEGKASYLQTFCGTVCYSAPEMLRGEKYAGEKVDVWSLGIILYALLKGELPFDEDDDAATKAKILKEDPVYPDTFPESSKSLISRLLSKRPLHRPTLADVLADPFLADHAPQQQAILKLSQPAPFTTQLEKDTLERMKAAGVDIDKVIENVLAQRCDSLAGWWTLLIQKETRKQIRKEQRRKEREADLKILRRLSGASSRLERIAPTLVEVDEEGNHSETTERRRSSSRGRTQRRSTPQIVVGDLPRLPEGDVVPSAGTATPPPPIDKDSVRSQSGSRPPLPPKERSRRSSTLQLVTTNPDLLGSLNGVSKRRGGKLHNRRFLTALKHWFAESTKRAKSPTTPKNDKAVNGHLGSNQTAFRSANGLSADQKNRFVIGTVHSRRSSHGSALTPVMSNSNAVSSATPNLLQRIDSSGRGQLPRNSTSPAPLTPRSSYRRSSTGLRGRKSTSSSVSSIRSMPRQTSHHSKASSQSSNSLDTIHSTPGPGPRTSSARSPRSSIKVLPATPTVNTMPSTYRLATVAPRGLEASAQNRPVLGALPGTSDGSASGLGSGPATPQASTFGSGVMFARRKKSPFKGPMLNSSFFSASTLPAALGSPAIVAGRNREGSAGKMNLGLKDLVGRTGSGGVGGVGGGAGAGKRKSQIIEEEEEEEEDDDAVAANNPRRHVSNGTGGDGLLEGEDEDEEEEVEEVEAFNAIELNKGERVESITIWDDAVEEGEEGEQEEETYLETGQHREVVGKG
ncbi:CAMK/CAMKL/MARK protein kinase [Capronia coronata CBS 617.96]|uniref:CAMK/CAMKL/MARK protein kinase n=1 Tax=Capronia coronata CBS 617.96 TaxID=1182541 RepID=W9YSS6_9EURO|nr:CAMK/CAMKL/MARK protein kinase [Capronia coronata CBS 617.96]EXJ95932.1 CAMK/CAMKL/MARK protein kinase [Capronia coronata CBS 617.96]